MLFKVDNVTYYYQKHCALSALSMVLEEGLFYGILGPNGCGKTTLLDLLYRHRDPTSGMIVFRSQNLQDYAAKQLAKEMALVPQNFYINFPYTVKEIVMMGRYPHIPRFGSASSQDWDQILTVMEQTETLQFAERLVTELSGGERQRVLFARALVQDTPVILLDEATSNCDIHHTLKLLSLAAAKVQKEGKTVVAVLQDINLAAMFCDHLVFMRNGSAAFAGEKNSVLNPDTLRLVFQIEAKVQFDAYANTQQVVFRR